MTILSSLVIVALPAHSFGDINDDGVVNAADSDLLYQIPAICVEKDGKMVIIHDATH